MRVRSIMNGRVATALTMLLIFLCMSVAALGFPPKARLMPLLVGVPGCLLGFVQLFIEIRDTAKEDQDTAGAEARIFAWILLFFAGTLFFGFIYMAPLLVFCFLKFGSRESTLVSVLGTFATWAVLYFIFEQAFAIPLFEGLVAEWLAG